MPISVVRWWCTAILVAAFASILSPRMVSNGPPSTTANTPAADLDRLLAFESSGWSGGPEGTLGYDDKVVHGGARAGRLVRTSTSPSQFSVFTASLPMDFSGMTVELHGFLKTDGVKGWVGLWMRQDSDSGTVGFDNMQKEGVTGTNDWAEHTISLHIQPTGRTLFFGALLAGEGTLWVDDLRLLVDGEPIQNAPKIVLVPTALEKDKEFDAGSKIAIDSLTPIQVENLALLGKVWGFLKYHHPKVTAGDLHWDYELFRVMPGVLAAKDGPGARKTLLEWAKKLGEIPACTSCAKLPEGLAIVPDLGWIHDRKALGEELASYLELVYKNRPDGDDQAYLSLMPMVGNPDFRREKAYAAPPLPDAGFRILALYRWWNAVQYWSPNRDVIGADWNAVLPEFLPRFVAAKDVDRYHLELLAVISRLNDGHANLWSALDARPPQGDCQVPVLLRWVEGKPVVVAFQSPGTAESTKLHIADALLTIGDVPVPKLMADWKPYYSASNDVHRTAGMLRTMTQGACGPVKLGIERDGSKVVVTTERRPNNDLNGTAGFTHDLPGPTFRRLSPEVAYLKLSSVKAADIPSYLKDAEGTKGWIVDIRNYPSEFMPFALGGHFVSESTPFVRFTFGDPANPGAFAWGPTPLAIPPLEPRYAGRIVVLVDESTISQAEYTAMALRAVPNAIVVGSTTAGADGNVSTVPLPGGLQSWISGIGILYPDKRPTQRVGIVPDVEVRPTVAGVREGRDEVLEAAIRKILGDEVPDSKVRALAKPADEKN